MKKKKPKIIPPRITWERKPMTQVKSSDKIYNRKKLNRTWEE
jgi:hypothetical protein